MRLFATFLIGLIAMSTLASSPRADETAPGQASDKAAAVQVPRTVSGKRQWLRTQSVKGIEDPRQVRDIQRVVDRMTVPQINEAIQGILAQQLPQNDGRQAAAQAAQAAQLTQEAQMELARARALREYLEYLVWMQRGRVGYAPIITWLPEGTQFGAGAVISPDGRYARINTQPFFSSIGPVYTYNLNTGETRLQQPYPYQDPYQNPNYSRPNNGNGNNNGFNSGYNGGIPSWHLPPQPQNNGQQGGNNTPRPFRG